MSGGRYLEDDPMACKWLVSIVSTVSPMSEVAGPLPNGEIHGL